MSEKRKYIRFPTNSLVWWSKDWEAEPIALMDISAGGMLCEFPEPMESGSKISLHFEFPKDDQMIFCNARVVHCRPQPGRHLYMVGLKIIELEGMDQTEFVQRIKAGLLKSKAMQSAGQT